MRLNFIDLQNMPLQPFMVMAFALTMVTLPA
jgi:hypothetical protein